MLDRRRGGKSNLDPKQANEECGDLVFAYRWEPNVGKKEKKENSNWRPRHISLLVAQNKERPCGYSDSAKPERNEHLHRAKLSLSRDSVAGFS